MGLDFLHLVWTLQFVRCVTMSYLLLSVISYPLWDVCRVSE